MFIIKLLSQHVSGIIMPIIRRTRMCTAAYCVLHWAWWLWLCGAGTRAVCTVKVKFDNKHQIGCILLVSHSSPIGKRCTCYDKKVKVKCSRYRPGVAQRVGRVIALLFHDRGTRRWWVISSTPRLHFTPGKDPVPILQEAGWTPGPVWTDGKSRPRRDSIPDRPARSSVAIPTELPGYTLCWLCEFTSRALLTIRKEHRRVE